MSFSKEFSYPDISRRRLIYFNAFSTVLISGFIFADISFSMMYYLFYFPVIKVIAISAIIGIFTGNLTGRFLFAYIKKFRIIYILSEFLFIILSILYMLRKYIFNGLSEPLILLFNYSPFLIPLIVFLILFFVGIKTNYFLKISCGDFIDEKQGIIQYIGFSLFGAFIGISLSCIRMFPEYYHVWTWLSLIIVFFPLLMLPLIFMIRLPYNPSPIYTQQFEEEGQSPPSKNLNRGNLFFNYLNFTYITIYIYLGFESIIKFYGDISHIKITFVLITVFGILLGLLIGKIARVTYWHINAEMIFPILFLSFIILIFNYHEKLPFYYGMVFFVPLLIVFGFSLYHTISNIIANYSHKKRFNIIDFSIFILPVPILISISFINFTYLWYFTLIYIFTIMNIIIPGISLINRDVRVYKKAIYFLFSLIFIPLLIFIHVYFDIPIENDIYVTKTKNFNELQGINYNALYIKNKASIQMNRSTVFNISDSIIRNLKRSLVPIVLYQPDENRKKILFIDGNQKFFRNPIIGYFKNSICLDTIFEKHIDYNKLPFSGRQTYIPDNDFLMLYLNKSRSKFYSIVDIPNILDQNINHFRFSEEYYRIIKDHLQSDGIFVQLFNITECRSEFFSESVKNLHRSFNKHIIYLFSDILVIMSSDNVNAFNIKLSNYKRFTELFNERKELIQLFYNESHIFSHLLSTDINYLLPHISESSVNPSFLLCEANKYRIDHGLLDKYTEENFRVLELIEKNREQVYFFQKIKNNITNNNRILTHLKKIELAESNDNYEDETNYLFELKKYVGYRSTLRKYLNNILSYKEEYYYNAALRLEKDKKWEDAKKLYKAILTINRNNFDANYRMGLLCITLQDIENSFKYLQHSMRLQKDHPKVLYQMGVLLFSSGRTVEAINYLTRALQLKERSASVYLYLGLSYEKLGNLNEAEYYYTRVQLEDPNDINIKTRLDSIKKKKEDEKNKWKSPSKDNQWEDEQGEDMPLPINKSAYDIRLREDEGEKE